MSTASISNNTSTFCNEHFWVGGLLSIGGHKSPPYGSKSGRGFGQAASNPDDAHISAIERNSPG